MGRTSPVEPEAFVEPNGVDDQRVPLPPADGMAVVGRREIRRVRPAIRVDGPVGVWATDVEDVDALQLGELDDLDTVRREKRPCDAGRLAPRMRLQLIRVAIGQERGRPWLQGNRRPFSGRRRDDAAAWQPDAFFCRRGATQQDPAIRRSRRRLGGWAGRTAASGRALTSRGALASVRHADLHVGAPPPPRWLRGLLLWRRLGWRLGLLREQRDRWQRQQHRAYTQNKNLWSHLAIS